MAFTLSDGPVTNSGAGVDNVTITLTDVEVGDLIAIFIWAQVPLRNITSITCTDEADLTIGHQFTLFGDRRLAAAYLINATVESTKQITVTLDGTVAQLLVRGMAVKPPAGLEDTVTFDDGNDASSTGTNGAIPITTTRDESFIFAGLLCGTGADPIIEGADYTQYAPSLVLQPILYDLDAGAASSDTVDWTQDSAFWAGGAMSFSHDSGVLLDYTGDGGVEVNGAAGIESTLGTDFDYTGDGGVEVNGAADIVDATPTDFEYTGAGGLEVNSSATPQFIETNNFGEASFEPLEAEGAGVRGTSGVGRGYFEPLQATGEAVNPWPGTGEAVFEAMTAIGYGPTFGEASFEPMTATGQATQGGVGVASFKPLEVVRVEGVASFQPLAAVGYGQVIVSDEYTTKVVNLRTGAVTEFTNHEYNSFARIGTKYYGAGPAGLVRLEGDTDPSNTDIDWHVKTGQMDDKDPGLKRLPEVVLGLRASDRVTVRVHPDDNTSHDYQLPVVQTNTIHQHRVKPGKGMRGRWFAVALLGNNNTTLELDSMQVNMTKTTRRLG